MAGRTGIQAEDDAVTKYIHILATDFSSSKTNEMTKLAQEYFRRLKMHAQPLSSLKPTSELKYVIACDLAAESLGNRVDKDQAIKTAGVSLKNYEAYRTYAGNLLEVNNGATVKDIGIRLGIEAAIPTAVALLAEFKKEYAHVYEGVPEDQFVATALFVVCGKIKLPPRKKELVAVSKLKVTGFTLLAEQMASFYHLVAADNKDSRSMKKKTALDRETESSLIVAKKTAGASNEEKLLVQNEDYQTFRTRTLREAFSLLQKDDPAKYDLFVTKYKNGLQDVFMDA